MKSKNLTQSKLGWVVQRPLLLILLISVILRVGAAFYMGDTVIDLPGIFDQISYHNLALRVAGGNGFSFGELWWPITPANAPTAHWSFLYTLYLTLIYILFSPHPIIARIIQAIIVGILHPYITYRIGEKVFNRNVGLAAAAVTAIYIYFFYYGAALMTEPFYITTIVLSLYMALLVTESRDIKREIWLGVALGVSIGIALLLRQVYLLFLPFLFLWVWIVRFRQNRSLPIVSTGISIALIVVFVLPVTLYNYSRFDRFVLLNTNSGYAFFWGNNPIYGTKFIPILPTEAYRDMIPEELRHLDEAALDQELLKRGMQFVMDDPQRYVLLSLSRIPPYFKFWYSADSGTLSNISRIASFGVTLPFMIYGLVLGVKKILVEKGNRLWNLIISPIGLLLLFTVVYSGVHILTWTLVRYRLPVDAVLIPFAGLALVDIAERITKRRLQVVTE
jgi:4-amino-4-deoxy-L-arabinose transferase-like glycosyltransferase